jgi:hypothetical protein
MFHQSKGKAHRLINSRLCDQGIRVDLRFLETTPALKTPTGTGYRKLKHSNCRATPTEPEKPQRSAPQ